MFIRIFILSLVCFVTIVPIGRAQTDYSALVIDVGQREITFAHNIDQLRAPAALTQLMTLYLTFEAFEDQRLSLNQILTVSEYAARMGTSRYGLKAGDKISVREAIEAVAMNSASDVAIVLAEAHAGSEPLFVGKMTDKARQLHMKDTQFRNAYGLAHPQQVTNAKDMGRLILAMYTDFPQYIHHFSEPYSYFKGRRYRNDMPLIYDLAYESRFNGRYQRATGSNLAISVGQAGSKRRFLAVLFDTASSAVRNSHMQALILRGLQIFNAPLPARPVTSPTVAPHPPSVPTARSEPVRPESPTVAPHPHPHPPSVPTARSAPVRPESHLRQWGIQVGAFSESVAARSHLSSLRQKAVQVPTLVALTQGQAQILPIRTDNELLYRVRFIKLTHAQAIKLCQNLNEEQIDCFLVTPG